MSIIIKKDDRGISDTYAFPENGSPPAARYVLQVDYVLVTKSEKTGSHCLDACCLILGRESDEYFIKQRIAVGTPFLNDLLSALKNIGVQIGMFQIEDPSEADLYIDLKYDADGHAIITYLDY